ncbi:MAG TPA: hypothetical protein VK146_01825 [Tabrizicola sp.]|nr:hypothetical protein [Tabrizicola sp.]
MGGTAMNPVEIYQSALNKVSAAVLAGDFAAFLTSFDLPYLLHTDSDRLLASTADDLHDEFQALHQLLKFRGVTHYERVARRADYVDRKRIEGLHYTHQIKNGSHVAPPQVGRETLFLRDDRWLFCEAYFPTQMLSAIARGGSDDIKNGLRT